MLPHHLFSAAEVCLLTQVTPDELRLLRRKFLKPTVKRPANYSYNALLSVCFYSFIQQSLRWWGRTQMLEIGKSWSDYVYLNSRYFRSNMVISVKDDFAKGYIFSLLEAPSSMTQAFKVIMQIPSGGVADLEFNREEQTVQITQNTLFYYFHLKNTYRLLQFRATGNWQLKQRLSASFRQIDASANSLAAGKD